MTTTTRTRTFQPIATTICTTCFVAIPADQTETHSRWHEGRAAHARTLGLQEAKD